MTKLKTVFKIWLPFAVTITAFCALTYATVQQSYRQNANDPQVQMAQDAADAIVDGKGAETIVPSDKVSVAKSLAPFLIAFDREGNIIASSVILDGQTPELPDGVLESTKELGENRITWQPRSDVRIASVIVSYEDGYVLAGRNMREVEARGAQLTTFAGITWALALLASLVVVAFGEYFLSEKK
jgi:hypothetical protein